MSADLFSINGRVALVTGASSGLGAHFAKVLASAGAKVVVAARRAEKLDALVASIQENGGEAIAVTMDVTNSASVVSAFDMAEKSYGTVDILVNNAGVAATKRFLEADEDNWDFIVETNLKGAWRVAREAALRLSSSGTEGSIVNIASILGLHVGFENSIYSISKAGVVQMTKAMALELARKKIRVNAICPGYFKTEMNDSFFESDVGKNYAKKMTAQRIGRLEELSGALLLLASNAGSFINGVALPVDGGHLVQSL